MTGKQQKQQRPSPDLSSSPTRTISDATKMGLMNVAHGDALFIPEADPFMTDKSPVLSSMPSPITTSYDSSSSTPLTSSPKSTFFLSSPTSSPCDNGRQHQHHHHRSSSRQSSISNNNNNNGDGSSISCHTNLLLDDETYFQLSEYLAQSSPSSDYDNSTTGSIDSHNRLSLTESPAAPAAALNMDGLQIRVIGAPDKSRVETQTRLCIQLLTTKGTKVSSWPYLKLPEHLLARSRLKRSAQRSSSSSSPSSSAPTSPSSSTTLLASDGRTLLSDESSKVIYLDAKVVCASQPDQPVKVCSGCIQRERKRAERSKNGANQHKNNSDRLRLIIDDIPEQDRILLFNCGPMVNFSSGDAILPTRITCYCRHHNEKVGFCVQFTMKTDNGDIIATGMSPPILITDDHKSTRQKSRKRDRSAFETASLPSLSMSSSNKSNSTTGSSNTNKPARRLPPPGLSTAVAPVTPATSRRGSLTLAAAMENMPSMDAADPSDFSILDNSTTITTAFDSSSLPTPGEERNPFGNPLSFFPPITTATAATSTSSAPSPSAVALHHALAPPSSSTSSTTASPVLNPLEHRLLLPPQPPLPPAMSEQYVAPENLSSTRTPQLERLVPAQGPTYGGCEVTVLGANFYRGLTCLFGEHQATTIFWNANTLVCLLPPAAHPGPVVVSFKQHSLVLDGQDVPLFTYYDANDQALLELALQVVGLKTTGKLLDAKQIAMRIVQGGDNSPLYLHNHNNGSGATNNDAAGTSDHDAEDDDDNTTTTLEDTVIQALDTYRVTTNELLHATNDGGHTLLHLAVWMGYTRLACKIAIMCHEEALNVCDRNGYTPLSLARIKGNTAIIQDIILARSMVSKRRRTTTSAVNDMMLFPIMRRFYPSSSLLAVSQSQANGKNNKKVQNGKNCFDTLWPSTTFQSISMLA
ncbi:hypothetical protein BDB00DRAFT_873684 [Zychaea mexicana]|uniref:uncharacterized protein n=1 Tax=Zychaea mexicana TaxID=64656 RepID=UPI0022FDDBFB|nr:uncharacterized protein BDB00DRAFT_873684 [Zychaea mexicana]KAI9492030.1 hypothetical protein BDB00DRAFT_873684 [Zychaea mexicana]